MGETITVEDAWQRSRESGNNFDAIRLCAAALVIFSHAFEISDGARINEPLARLSGELSLGGLSVLIFFAASGYLITKSWMAQPRAISFLKKRALRIFPALLAVTLLTALLFGPLMSSLPVREYFSDTAVGAYILNAFFIASFDSLPGVFADNPFPSMVNAPLWTLAFEISCYAIVLILGMAGFLNRVVCSIIIAVLIIYIYIPDAHSSSLAGDYLYKLALLAPTFFMGALFALMGDYVPLDWRLAVISVFALLFGVFSGALVFMFVFFGSYLTLYIAFASLGVVRFAGAHGDFSYGLYIWGWPVEQAVIAIWPDLAWRGVFLIAFPVTLGLAILSWNIIEKPALALKRRSLRPKSPAA